MVDKKYSVYGRKIPLKQIHDEMTEEQIGMDIIRWNKDSIDNIGMTEVTIFFSQIDEPVPDDLERVFSFHIQNIFYQPFSRHHLLC
jgi:hypothetical protein